MDRKANLFILIAVAVLLILPGCTASGSGQMKIENAWVRASVGGMGTQSGVGSEMHSMGTPAAEGMSISGMNTAAYMVIRNETGVADRLLRVESDAAQVVETHQTTVENEVMTMRPVEGIEIPAGGEVVLEPGGYHIMLIGLKQPLSPGQKVPLVLIFEKAGSLTVDAEVRAP